jgi:hypothetical protein
MPVQFLSGGGGGTSDVRTTFADPVRNSCVFTTTTSTTQLLSKWTIPANYFQVNDFLVLTILAKSTGTAENRSITANIRLGTTGTISDPTLVTIAHNHNVAPLVFLENIVSYKANIAVQTIGSSGTALLHLQSDDCTGYPAIFTPLPPQTINTTVPLYLSVFLTGNVLSSTTLTINPVASSLIVGF